MTQEPVPQAPLPQAWVPRVVNVAVAVVLAACLSPIVYLGQKPVWVQVLVLLFCTPVALVIAACLMSALRPGSLGRLARRLRRR